MIRIRGLLKIFQMATRTSIGCILVIPVVTGGAIHGDHRMGAQQRVIAVVVRKLGRAPSWLRTVTGSTIHRQTQGHMVGIDRLVEIFQMAGTACRWRSRKASRMTIQTICLLVSAGQRKPGLVMIKNVIRATRGVTSQTSCADIDKALDTLMLILGLGIEMACQTSKIRPIPRIHVTIRTSRPFTGMRTTVNGEILSVMIKRGWLPGGFIMTGGAVSTELETCMVGIIRLVVILLVATRTGIGCILVIPVMTGGAIHSDHRMGANQRIIIVVVRKLGGTPSGLRTVTGGAIHRQT